MLNIQPIKAFSDNYLWLFKQKGSSEACIVDPGDAAPVIKHLEDNQLSLSAILITHHHADHIGGVNELLSHFDVPVYGPESSTIPMVSEALDDGDKIEAANTTFEVMTIPGHTMDHIAYYSEEEDILFCGDTLFAGGCGRIFEGTPVMMYNSLQRLAGLKPETQVYCAHEYTLGNLAFAESVSPNDQELLERIQIEKEKRKKGQPTIPTSIQLELSTNPFLRCSDESFSKHLGEKSRQAVDVFTTLREMKDNF